MSRAYRLINNGRTIGHFPSLDEAMRAAQDRGFVRRADEDEGGPAFAVLVPTVEIIPVLDAPS